MSWLVVLMLIGVQPDTAPITLNHCKVVYKHSTKLGLPNMGLIQGLSVQLGEQVHAGQVLAHLPINEEIAEAALAEATAMSDVALRLAKVQQKQAEVKAYVSRKLHERNACSVEQYNLDCWAAEGARVAVEQATENRRIASLTYDRAKARLAARQVVAPHDGVVGEIYKYDGESVTNSDSNAVLRLDDTSTLQIAGKLDIRDAQRVKVGDSVKIRFETLVPDVDNFAGVGTVSYLDTKIDPIAQTRLVIVEVPNDTKVTVVGLEASLQINPTDIAVR